MKEVKSLTIAVFWKDLSFEEVKFVSFEQRESFLERNDCKIDFIENVFEYDKSNFFCLSSSMSDYEMDMYL